MKYEVIKFKGPRQMAEYINTTPNKGVWDYAIENDTPAHLRKFFGYSSVSAALDVMTKGDVKNAKRIKEAGKILEAQTAQGSSKFERSVVGVLPNVPAYILGLPKQMYNVKREYNKKPVLSVFVNVTVPCYIEADDMAMAGAKIANVVKAIESKGYRLNLSAFCAINQEDGSAQVISLKIKDSDSALNLFNAAFGLINPAFFRAACLSVLQKRHTQISGHGMCIYHNEKEIKEALSVKDSIVLSLYDIISQRLSVDSIANKINEAIK